MQGPVTFSVVGTGGVGRQLAVSPGLLTLATGEPTFIN